MKKIIITVLGLVLFFYTINFKSQDVTASGNVQAIPMPIYYNGTVNGINRYGQFDQFLVGGQTAYCVDITTSVTNGAWYTDSGNTKFDENTWNNLSRISHFGYGGGYLPDTPNLLYATQLMIWQTAHGTSNITIRSGGYFGSVVNLDNEINAINNLINQRTIAPSFNGQVINMKKGETITLTDTNNILSQFSIKSFPNEISASINGNDLTIIANNVVNNAQINMSKNFNNNGKSAPLLLVNPSSQTLMPKTLLDPLPASVSVFASPITSDLTLLKVDEVTGASLEDTTFSLQKLNTSTLEYEELFQITTDVNGVINATDLVSGEYQLVEVSSSVGYLIDMTPIQFTVDDTTFGTVIELQFKNMFYSTVELTKVDFQTRTPLQGVKFKIEVLDETTNEYIQYVPNDKYSFNDTTVNFSESVDYVYTTDANGKIFDYLPYGKYRFVEVEALGGYIFDEAIVYEFEVTEAGAKITIEAVNQKLPELPKTGSVDISILSFGLLSLLTLLKFKVLKK